MEACFHFSPMDHPRPEIIQAMRFPLNDRCFEVEYRHSGFHALHLHFYHGAIRTPDGDYPIQPGDITLTPAGYSTRYALQDRGFHLCIHFRLQQAGGFALPFHIPGHITGEEAAAVFRQIISWRTRADSDDCRAAEEYNLLYLLTLLYDMVRRNLAGDQNKITRIVAELDQNLENPPRIGELAEKYQWSRPHLARVFKRICGCTISQYIMRNRMERAQVLLETSDLPIKEIGMLVGYANAQEFYKRYRQIRGHAPSWKRRPDLSEQKR